MRLIVLVCMMVLFSSMALGQTKYSFTSDARIRHEIKTNSDYDKAASDRISFTGSRFRLNISAQNESGNLMAFLQPQYVSYWGEPEYVPSGIGGSSVNSSGALNDKPLDIHQAYITWRFNDSISIEVGRQELNYGDQLVVGGVAWHNVGRSFDLTKFVYKFSEKNRVDLFASKLVDTNVSSSGSGDLNLYGIYFQGSFGQYLNNLDFYLLDKNNRMGNLNDDIYTLGTRAKSSFENFDYRLEANWQEGRPLVSSKSTGEGQFDMEIGYTFSSIKTRVALEGFYATEEYDQLFPTAHKWLGFADQFSRRNIQGYSVHLKNSLVKKWDFALSYHVFRRYKGDHSAYRFNGQALGVNGSSKDIGSEIDLTVAYSFSPSLKLQAGYSMVDPGKYLEDQNVNWTDQTEFGYLQLFAKF